jgi:hypothetical protein
LIIATADPAAGEEHEGDREDRGRCAGMHQHVMQRHSDEQGQRDEAADQHQSDPVRDGHREKVA